MSTTILTVDDDQRFLAIVRRCLEEDPDLSLVGEVTDGEQAVRLAEKLQPDVVLMDISMPRMNGLEATRQIKSRQPDTKVVIVTMHDEEAYRNAAADSGAEAFLSKKRVVVNLLATIRRVTGEAQRRKSS